MANPADHQATVAARLEDLTGLYERSAYLIYNVAARVAGDDDAAQRAARRAMLAQVGQPDPDRLAADAARFAIEEAVPVDPRGVSDPVLSANARLSSPVRAALALTTLASASDELLAGAVTLDQEAAAALRDRGWESLAEFLGVPAAEAETAYRDLDWAEPPAELWQQLYPELHAAVAHHARTAAAAAAEAEAPAAPRRRLRRPRLGAPLRALRRRPRWALVLVLVLAAGGVAAATSGVGGSGTDGEEEYEYASPAPVPGTASEGGDSGGSSYDALTPRELDELRKQELEDLKRYSKKQADKRLSSGERAEAAKRAARIARLARKRERAAAKRELAARRQLARERAARMEAQQRAAQQQAAQQQAAQQPRPPRQEPREDRSSGDQTPSGTGDDSTAECYYDEQSGAYECPQ